MKTFLYFVGKPKDASLNAAAEDFLGRAGRYAPCEMREVHPSRFNPFEQHRAARKIALDPAGQTMDSAQFANVYREAERLGRDLVFLVGGHDGLDPQWRAHADLLLSLSRMTFPHEMARLMLAEQIYRAFAILRNHPYVR